MKRHICGCILALAMCVAASAAEWPGPIEGGYLLPNGWTITPPEKHVDTEDLILNMQPSPDGRRLIALHGGFNAHGLVVLDLATNEVTQRIPLPTAWLGLAWHPNGALLYVSGGNNRKNERAPVYVFSYKAGKLSNEPVSTLAETIEPASIAWTGLAHHPKKNLLFAANSAANNVVVFDSESGAIVTRIPVEKTPCDLAITPDGKTLYCSNWASDTVSVIDTESLAATSVIGVGDNPSNMVLAKDGRLFVCCANDNSVVVIDTKQRRTTETIVTSLYERAPEGSTPDAVALSPDQKTLYVANADNYNVCVVDIRDAGESTVLGFIPSGWYPSAVAVHPKDKKLYIGNAKGQGSYSDIRGPHSPLPPGAEGNGTVKSLMKGSISIVDIPSKRRSLRALTQQAYANSPYNDSLLAQARPPKEPSVVPSVVGAGSPIKHVIYIIKENRTYDQVLGDMPQGNGDPRITIFGREVTPNIHAIAEQFVLLDNLYCDAEVSVDGHMWSNAAYATDYTEKHWPAAYGGKSSTPDSDAEIPGAGFLWDQCQRKGLTYRSYGEFAGRISEGKAMEPQSKASNLHGHVAPNYLCWGARDTDNAVEFFREFDEFEKNFDSPDPNKRLPNFIVMSLPEDHTRGTSPGAPTPRAAVASNDYALGQILDRVSHSKYWPYLAVFTVEDDAQDGADHVDARRTESLVASAYCKRGIVDSTFYTTSAILRTIELLLGLQPMSQYDAAANPMYAAFGTTPNLAPYTHLKPTYNIGEINQATAWGAKESQSMDFSDFDRTPMFALNEIVWKSIKGPESEMPPPVHRFQFGSLYTAMARP